MRMLQGWSTKLQRLVGRGHAGGEMKPGPGVSSSGQLAAAEELSGCQILISAA